MATSHTDPFDYVPESIDLVENGDSPFRLRKYMYKHCRHLVQRKGESITMLHRSMLLYRLLLKIDSFEWPFVSKITKDHSKIEF